MVNPIKSKKQNTGRFVFIIFSRNYAATRLPEPFQAAILRVNIRFSRKNVNRAYHYQAPPGSEWPAKSRI
jgi:dTDP-4-dehydrorhamnose 3,5-epimerase-like enzyme